MKVPELEVRPKTKISGSSKCFPSSNQRKQKHQTTSVKLNGQTNFQFRKSPREGMKHNPSKKGNVG